MGEYRYDCIVGKATFVIFQFVAREVIHIMIKLITFVLIVVYAGGIWKFWKGFRRTNFDTNLSNRIVLSAFWPVLLVANKSYRHNFNKALKG